jgi:hypothetical protein
MVCAIEQHQKPYHSLNEKQLICPSSIRGEFLSKRPLTINYIIFYILFSPDTWRILIGIGVAAFLAPNIIQPNQSPSGAVVIYLMIAAIGYAFSARPGRWISDKMKRALLAGNRPK